MRLAWKLQKKFLTPWELFNIFESGNHSIKGGKDEIEEEQFEGLEL